jgi:hypothetical protein
MVGTRRRRNRHERNGDEVMWRVARAVVLGVLVFATPAAAQLGSIETDAMRLVFFEGSES